MTTIDGSKEDETEDRAEGWKTCLANRLGCILDSGAKDRLSVSNAYTALHAGPDLRIDEIPRDIW